MFIVKGGWMPPFFISGAKRLKCLHKTDEYSTIIFTIKRAIPQGIAHCLYIL